MLSEAVPSIVAALPPQTSHPTGDELFNLGLKYSTGVGGTPVDYVAAHTAFNLAAILGSLEAKVYRRELSAEMDPHDVAQAQRAARAWLGGGSCPQGTDK